MLKGCIADRVYLVYTKCKSFSIMKIAIPVLCQAFWLPPRDAIDLWVCHVSDIG